MTKLLILITMLFLLGCETNTTLVGTTSEEFAYKNKQLYPVENKDDGGQFGQHKLIKWQSQSENVLFNWDGHELNIKRTNERKKPFFYSFAKSENEFTKKEVENKGCYNGHSFRIASVVGSIVSFEHEQDFSCGAISSLSWRYYSIDVQNVTHHADANNNTATRKKITYFPGKILSLLDLFSEEELLNALLASKKITQEITKAIDEQRIASIPQNMVELNNLITSKDYSVFEGEFYFEQDFLTRFAFHKIIDEKVYIRLSLSAASHANQADQEIIEIFLPINEKHKDMFILADSKKQGFLMKDARKLVGSNFAKFEFNENK